MNNDNKLPSDWVEKKLKMLREELESHTQWSEQARRLLSDLAGMPSNSLVEGDETMLSIVIDDALKGIDISERYPDFYRRMLHYPEIFQAFLDAVEVLEADAAGLLEPSPTAAKSSVPGKIFSGVQARLDWSMSGVWIARWRQTVGELNALFNTLKPLHNRAYRGELEEGAMTLIRSEVAVEDKDFGVLLTAALADDADKLKLQLSVALIRDDSAVFPYDSLRAGLHWGKYNQVSAINEYGQAVFPLLPISDITDNTGQTIKSDLQLLLHPIT